MFATLSDRLTATFKSLRGKGRLSEADVDATVREIRRALLDADVALPVVRHPAVLAAALTSLAALHPGPVVAGIGPGSGRADYAAARTAHTQGALHAPALAA